ncbi:nucleolar zinc-finger protein [Naganishia albida]|nr:nucleolar zinc-finger protein [Naganishia albida]
MASENLFKSIGDVATNIDAQVDRPQEGKQQDVAVGFEDENREVQEVESMCMECGKNGVTRMLLTVIPYFREVIVMSFRCEHCGNSNTEIQQAGEIQTKGCVHTVHVLDPSDLNRQVVKSNTGTVTIPEVALTIPASRGQLTNIEGILRDTVRDLSLDQPLRKITEPEAYEKIATIIERLKCFLGEDDEEEETATGEIQPAKHRQFTPFTFKIDDPAGNSFVSFVGSTADSKWSMRVYNRTRAQNVALGLVSEEEAAEGRDATANSAAASDVPEGARKLEGQAVQDAMSGSVVPEEIFAFPGSCSSCGHQIDTLMQRVNIPHFKDIIIMSTNCEHCGYRDNEVKSGAAISEKGKKIVLKVEDEEDLSRDILKSETCGLEIPEIDLVLQPGTLGGRFTTLEGMLNQVYDELSTKVFQTGGDSMDSAERNQFEKFLGDMKAVMSASRPFTLIMDDPVANSYLQNLYAPDPDPNMEVTVYDRTDEQNEELGLSDMVLTGYNPEIQDVIEDGSNNA